MDGQTVAMIFAGIMLAILVVQVIGSFWAAAARRHSQRMREMFPRQYPPAPGDDLPEAQEAA